MLDISRSVSDNQKTNQVYLKVTSLLIGKLPLTTNKFSIKGNIMKLDILPVLKVKVAEDVNKIPYNG